MTIPSLQPINPHGQLRAGELARLGRATEQLDRVSGAGGVLAARSAAGTPWVLDRPRKFWARVLSGTNPYLCSEVYDAGDGSYPLAPDGLTAVTAWERGGNAKVPTAADAGGVGAVVRLTPDPRTETFSFGHCCGAPIHHGGGGGGDTGCCFSAAPPDTLYAHWRTITGDLAPDGIVEAIAYGDHWCDIDTGFGIFPVGLGGWHWPRDSGCNLLSALPGSITSGKDTSGHYIGDGRPGVFNCFAGGSLRIGTNCGFNDCQESQGGGATNFFRGIPDQQTILDEHCDPWYAVFGPNTDPNASEGAMLFGDYSGFAFHVRALVEFILTEFPGPLHTGGIVAGAVQVSDQDLVTPHTYNLPATLHYAKRSPVTCGPPPPIADGQLQWDGNRRLWANADSSVRLAFSNLYKSGEPVWRRFLLSVALSYTFGYAHTRTHPVCASGMSPLLLYFVPDVNRADQYLVWA